MCFSFKGISRQVFSVFECHSEIEKDREREREREREGGGGGEIIKLIAKKINSNVL